MFQFSSEIAHNPHWGFLSRPSKGLNYCTIFNMNPWSSHKQQSYHSTMRKSLISRRIRSHHDNNKMELVGVKLMAKCVSHAQIFIFMIISVWLHKEAVRTETGEIKTWAVGAPNTRNGWQERHYERTTAWLNCEFISGLRITENLWNI